MTQFHKHLSSTYYVLSIEIREYLTWSLSSRAHRLPGETNMLGISTWKSEWVFFYAGGNKLIPKLPSSSLWPHITPQNKHWYLLVREYSVLLKWYISLQSERKVVFFLVLLFGTVTLRIIILNVTSPVSIIITLYYDQKKALMPKCLI